MSILQVKSASFSIQLMSLIGSVKVKTRFILFSKVLTNKLTPYTAAGFNMVNRKSWTEWFAEIFEKRLSILPRFDSTAY